MLGPPRPWTVLPSCTETGSRRTAARNSWRAIRAETSALKPVGTLCRPGHEVAGREGVVVISDAFLSRVCGSGSDAQPACPQPDAVGPDEQGSAQRFGCAAQG